MGDCFPVGAYRLAPVAVREVAGLIFVCSPQAPPDFRAPADVFAPQPDPYDLAKAPAQGSSDLPHGRELEDLVENNRECYHCAGSHPEFTLSNFDVGGHGDVRSNPRYESAMAQARRRWTRRGLPSEEVSFPDGAWFRIQRFPLREGFVTESLDGRPVAPLMGSLTDDDAGSLRMVGLPNMWAHANCDYAVTTRLTPIDAGTTDVELCFLVRGDAPPVDREALTGVWRSTSEQDWELCEKNYAGIASRGYRPGPLSPVVEASGGGVPRLVHDRARRAGAYHIVMTPPKIG